MRFAARSPALAATARERIYFSSLRPAASKVIYFNYIVIHSTPHELGGRPASSPSVSSMDGTTVCSMCGDVGFPDKLFRCARCRRRFQHSYVLTPFVDYSN